MTPLPPKPTEDDVERAKAYCRRYEHEGYQTLSATLYAALLHAEDALTKVEDRADTFRDLLKEILDIEHELEWIGGGPRWKERRAKAFKVAWEEFEP